MNYNISSFMPPFIEGRAWISEDNYKLTTFDMGVILSLFFIAQILFAPFISVLKNTLGTKNTIMFGFTLLSIATFTLGAIARLDNPHPFFWIAISARFVQGTGDITVFITLYNLIL